MPKICGVVREAIWVVVNPATATVEIAANSLESNVARAAVDNALIWEDVSAEI